MVINQERGNRTNPVMSSAVMSACSQGKKETIITVAIIVTIGTIYSALICSRHKVKQFTYIISFNPHNNLKIEMNFLIFHM